MKPETKVIHAGRHPDDFLGAVNTPVYRTSTVICSSMAEWDSKQRQQTSFDEPELFYGRHGTPTTKSLQEAIAELEGGYKSFVYPSGVSACATAILAFTSADDHVLVPDSVYGPVRQIAGTLLKRFRINVEFYDPALGADIEKLFRPETRVVYTEAPGSMTFEMQDIPAIAEAAHRHGAIVVMDNTWASPLYFQPFTKGVDISVQAATKYIVGHSDVMMGIVTATEATYQRLKATTHELGLLASPDDCYLAQRGLRTLHVRLERHYQTGLRLAEFIARQPEVARVIHPALPGDPGHALWKRDFTGASGLFAFALHPALSHKRTAFVEALTLFGIGGSWGGYESLILPLNPVRSVHPDAHPGTLLRIHAGLESVDDLLADLERAFALIRQS
ncbi:cystathionine beta-lyase [Pectobacterium versatile]|uniref:cystathionine beta-lyase n=1 Tax=Pectobacterium versatile TaxID=2488639 RepID=UPI00102F250B|nr:cystathionine beta-lyase [Pectobacterium versatile]GKV79726.1 cystathionine beta-lyase [Pectobacterium carotovorum subsp. carotovorum]MBQ4770670.1 cystathionine beta-lyase [Pectobacterium versatile]MBQ4794230.1 cystathionine beta-lyase [Pectobacterium versatile]TAJ05160.1 cystathionine beta-lyase [Pectobacterium versatile]GKX38562.1 cystathionine beta-lyase [Pectobacterium carotovorum subsp. carotovorum]